LLRRNSWEYQPKRQYRRCLRDQCEPPAGARKRLSAEVQLAARLVRRDAGSRRRPRESL